MKNTILITLLALTFVLPVSLFAQDTLEENAEEFGERMDAWGERMEEWGENIEEAVEEGDLQPPPPLPIGKNWNKYQDRSARFNAYLDDMDFEDAYHNHYPYCYGVYISDVIYNGNFDKAGLRGGDIIMEFDGEKVRFEDHLMQLRDSKNIGDTALIKFFRNEVEMETEVVFAAPKEDEDDHQHDWEAPDFEDMKHERKLHPGYGGGGPELILLEANLGAINDLLRVNGFDEINDEYIPLMGGFGMGNVGNGWFIGGAGYGYEKKDKISVEGGQRRYRLDIGFGGMTVNKKLPLTKNILVDLGLLVGGGGATLEMRERTGEYSWDISFDDNANFSSIEYRKGFFVYRPSVGLMVRLTPWMGIHGSVGYNGTYAFEEEWKDDHFDFPVSGDSPKPMDGMSYAVSFWFGH